MNRSVLVKASKFVLSLAHRYKGRPTEFLLDALLFSHLRTKHKKIERQFQTSNKSHPLRIDFINKTTNPAVIELAHRKKGKSVGFSPRANSSELKKLSAQTNKKWRYLLILDPSDTPLDEKRLRAQYGAFCLRGRPAKRKRVRVVYVHSRRTFNFLWPSNSVT